MDLGASLERSGTSPMVMMDRVPEEELDVLCNLCLEGMSIRNTETIQRQPVLSKQEIESILRGEKPVEWKDIEDADWQVTILVRRDEEGNPCDVAFLTPNVLVAEKLDYVSTRYVPSRYPEHYSEGRAFFYIGGFGKDFVQQSGQSLTIEDFGRLLREMYGISVEDEIKVFFDFFQPPKELGYKIMPSFFFNRKGERRSAIRKLAFEIQTKLQRITARQLRFDRIDRVGIEQLGILGDLLVDDRGTIDTRIEGKDVYYALEVTRAIKRLVSLLYGVQEDLSRIRLGDGAVLERFEVIPPSLDRLVYQLTQDSYQGYDELETHPFEQTQEQFHELAQNPAIIKWVIYGPPELLQSSLDDDIQGQASTLFALAKPEEIPWLNSDVLRRILPARSPLLAIEGVLNDSRASRGLIGSSYEAAYRRAVAQVFLSQFTRGGILVMNMGMNNDLGPTQLERRFGGLPVTSLGEQSYRSITI
jgi:hypothetical protein